MVHCAAEACSSITVIDCMLLVLELVTSISLLLLICVLSNPVISAIVGHVCRQLNSLDMSDRTLNDVHFACVQCFEYCRFSRKPVISWVL